MGGGLGFDFDIVGRFLVSKGAVDFDFETFNLRHTISSKLKDLDNYKLSNI